MQLELNGQIDLMPEVAPLFAFHLRYGHVVFCDGYGPRFGECPARSWALINRRELAGRVQDEEPGEMWRHGNSG